jgi:hypothetical protein
METFAGGRAPCALTRWPRTRATCPSSARAAAAASMAAAAHSKACGRQQTACARPNTSRRTQAYGVPRIPPHNTEAIQAHLRPGSSRGRYAACEIRNSCEAWRMYAALSGPISVGRPIDGTESAALMLLRCMLSIQACWTKGPAHISTVQKRGLSVCG